MVLFRPSMPSITRLMDERLWQPVIRVLKLVLILLLAHVLAKLTWQLLSTPADSAALETASLQRTDTRHDGIEKLTRELAGWQLFGKPEGRTIAPAAATSQAPLTHLQLTLYGVLASDDPAKAYAIIAGSNKQAHVYGIGGEVSAQTVVSAIRSDHVILQRAGRLETLTLPKNTAIDSSRNKGASSRTNDRVRGRLIDRRQDVRATALLNEFRNTLTSNPTELTQLIRVIPYQENGQFTGFRIQRVTGKARQLLRLGLRRGDVITSINGINLDSPMRGLEVMNGLRTSTELQLEVLRRGEALSFRFAL